MIRLLDTNALSAAMRNQQTMLEYLGRVVDDEGYLTSVVAEAELQFGIARLPTGRRREFLTQDASRILSTLGGKLLRGCQVPPVGERQTVV